MLQDIINEFELSVEEHVIKNMLQVSADELGLDKSAAHRLYISDEGIVVPKSLDRTLQYYGGFEYIEEAYRVDLGEYVLYTDSSERVDKCLEYHAEYHA